jgi:hypothetical protein
LNKTRDKWQQLKEGSPSRSSRNEGWRENLGAHPNLRALVEALLELCFLQHPYLARGSNKGTAGVALMTPINKSNGKQNLI